MKTQAFPVVQGREQECEGLRFYQVFRSYFLVN